MKRRRRVVRWTLTRAVLGLTTATAISWTLAIVDGPLTPMRFSEAPVGDNASLFVSRNDSTGRIAIAAGVSYVEMNIPREQHRPLDVLVPAWSRRDLLMSTGESTTARGVLATGWPLPCLWASFDQQPSTGYWWFKARDGVVVAKVTPNSNPFAPLSPRERTLPMRVLWLSLAVDILAWTGVWTVLIDGPRAAVRALRRRRGRCARCGYDVKGLAGQTCPECGG